MLQSTGDSPSITRLLKLIESGEKWAGSRYLELAQFIEGGSGELVITYSGLGYVAASTLYWLIATVNPDKNPVLHDSDTIALYRLVYREKALVIHFTTRENDPGVVRISDTARWTGGSLYIVGPRPPEVISALLRGTPLIQIPPASNEITYSLYENLLAYYTGLNVFSTGSKRVKRLRFFAERGFAEILEELLAIYGNVLGEVSKLDHLIVTSTGFMAPSSYVLVKALRLRGVRASYTPIDILEPKRGDNILFLYTSVEDHVIREKRFKAFAAGSRIYETRLNLDPLEVPNYVIILALSLLE